MAVLEGRGESRRKFPKEFPESPVKGNWSVTGRYNRYDRYDRYSVINTVGRTTTSGIILF